MEFITGLILGAAVFSLLWYFFYRKGRKERIREESVVLLEKIRHVAKLITVESRFSEIFSRSDKKNVFFNLISSRKKALIVVDSRVMVGFDLKKIRLEADPEHKTVRILHFPEPEILSIDNDLKYFDVKNGIFNRFDATDLTELNQSAREFILQKIPGSGILEKAEEKALESIKMMEEMVRAFGWHFSYDRLPGTDEKTKPALISPNHGQPHTNG